MGLSLLEKFHEQYRLALTVVIYLVVDLRVTLGITLIAAAKREQLVTVKQVTFQFGKEDLLQYLEFKHCFD